jgi:hypothetical protein
VAPHDFNRRFLPAGHPVAKIIEEIAEGRHTQRSAA